MSHLLAGLLRRAHALQGVKPGAVRKAPDLSNPWRVTRKGRIVCALDWAQGEPAMFLMPYPKVPGGVLYMIPRSLLPKLFTEEGLALPKLTEAAKFAARRMGLDETVMTLNTIADVIVANVADLRAMPAARPVN